MHFKQKFLSCFRPLARIRLPESTRSSCERRSVTEAGIYPTTSEQPLIVQPFRAKTYESSPIFTTSVDVANVVPGAASHKVLASLCFPLHSPQCIKDGFSNLLSRLFRSSVDRTLRFTLTL